MSDADDHRVERIEVAAVDRLSREHDLCANDEGIDAEMRMRRVRPVPFDPDIPNDRWRRRAAPRLP
jgi:hypothetical protein